MAETAPLNDSRHPRVSRSEEEMLSLRSYIALTTAAAHGLSKSKLAQAYFVSKKRTGEQNPDLEAELVSLATAAS